MTNNYVSDLRAFCAEWLKQNRGYDLIDYGFGAEHGGELTTGKLIAALDELEKLRAERAALGDAEHQWRIVTPNGPVHSFTQRDLDDRANWLPGVRLEQRTVYGTPWIDAGPEVPQRTVSDD